MARQRAPTPRGGGSAAGRSLVASLLVLVVALGAAAAAVYLVVPPRKASGMRPLDLAYSVYSRLESERYKRLALVARSLARAPEIETFAAAAAASADDAAALAEDARAVLALQRNGLDGGIAVLLGPTGQPLLASDPDRQIGQPAATPLVARMLGRQAAQGDTGVWMAGDHLYYAAVEPVVDEREFERLGLLLVGLSVDSVAEDALPPGWDALFVAPRPAGGIGAMAGTLPAPAASGLLDRIAPRLTAQGGFGRALQHGERVALDDVAVGRDAYDALLAPVRRTPEGGSGAGLLLLAPRRSEPEEQLLQLAIGLGGTALLGALLALLLSRWVGRSVTAPAARLGRAVDRLRAGELDPAELPSAHGPLGGVAASLAGLAGDLAQDRALRETASELAARPAPPAGAAEPAARQPATLLSVELRRYARPGTPATSAAAFGRDVERVRTAARERGGRVEGISGHRVLVAFRGPEAEERSLAALAAAAEVRRRLSLPLPEPADREGDEIEPPTLVLAAGPVVGGELPGGGRRRLLLGLAVQQLETLSREAAPGQVLLSRDVVRDLAGPFAASGFEPVSQRGLLTPQPLYALDPETLDRLTSAAGGALTAGLGALGAPSSEPEPGEVLAERFEIEERIGRGPLGTVYAARDRELGRAVALKLFRPQALAEPERFAALDSPLAVMRHLAHPSIARVHDFGVVAGRPFLARRHVPGHGLRRWIDLGPLPPAAALGAGRAIARALAAAHAEGAFHGRLRPGNVIVDAAGSVTVTDFGCAPLAPAGLDTAKHDPQGVSACYLAPEQEHGDPGDTRSDVYLWGLLLHDLLAGRAPTAARPRTDLPDLPEPLAALLGRCLSPEPERRPADGGELLTALGELSWSVAGG